MATPQPGMKKRQIIANSNRTMFMWIAGMSAVLGVCAVLSIFLTQHIVYKMKVISKLNDTAATVKSNIATADELVKNVRVYESNDALNSIKARPEDKALQVVLDALPADPNALALGSSLQQNLLAGASGVNVESINVQAVVDEADSGQLGTIPLVVTVSARDANSLKDMLTRMEKSIRTIDIDTMMLEKTDEKYTMTLNAHAYYLPGVTVQLKDQIVPVSDGKKKASKS
ncbi:hypothetical protein IPM09_04085 [Candidatus Saccharibacteria bacterium]|nr:MAG: hypothetical protein IPM09_04085 [Candidatus Saccharibacteria bacterium]